MCRGHFCALELRGLPAWKRLLALLYIPGLLAGAEQEDPDATPLGISHARTDDDALGFRRCALCGEPFSLGPHLALCPAVGRATEVLAQAQERFNVEECDIIAVAAATVAHQVFNGNPGDEPAAALVRQMWDDVGMKESPPPR